MTKYLKLPPFVGLLFGNKKTVVGLFIITIMIVSSLLASVVTTYDPHKRVGRPHESPSAEHLLGTTRLGRDVFSQMLHAGRISISVGVGAAVLSTFLSIIVGISAGYFGGKIDEFLVFLMNVVLVFPILPLILVLAAFLNGAGPVMIALIIGITSWAWGARVIRSQTLSLRQKEFVIASEVQGESSWRIILVEILPNLVSLVTGGFIGSVLYSVITEATLEYIGLGDALSITWGTMLLNAQNSSAILLGAYWEILPPCIMISLLGAGLALLNFSVDEISNPQLRSDRGMNQWKKLKSQQKEIIAETNRQKMAKEPTDTPAASALLEVKHLCVDYITSAGAVRAVDDVSFSIKKGEIFGLAGESGCGKSTVAFAIANLHKPPALISGGKILFAGEDVLNYNRQQFKDYRWNKVSVVFQSAMNSLNPVITIGEQISDVLRTHKGMAQVDAFGRAKELLEVVGIHGSRLTDYPHQFSGGMRQRIVIAIALALDPELIVMDEPTTALDVVVQREILQEIYKLKQKFGFSILFITHDLSLMVEFSDRIGIMYAGKLIEVANSKDILSTSYHPYTKGLSQSFPSIKGEMKELTGIPGSPLNLLNKPVGCRFQDRCTQVNESCLVMDPSLLEREPSHWAACHQI